MTEDWTRGLEDLLDGPSPAVLTTYRRDGTAVASPVWFRYHDSAFEVVIAEDDVKLRHLARRPRCSLLVFEAVPPFRGVRTDGEPTLHREGVRAARQEIAGRYLGAEQGRRFAEERTIPGVLLRLPAPDPHTWNLAGILPTGDIQERP